MGERGSSICLELSVFEFGNDNTLLATESVYGYSSVKDTVVSFIVMTHSNWQSDLCTESSFYHMFR